MKLVAPGIRYSYLFVILAICSVPVIYGFHYIDIYAINVPFWDQWNTIVPWTIEYYEGNFDFSRLIDEENDSRPFVPNTIILIASIFTNLDIKFMFYLGYIIFVVCILLLLVFLKEDTDLDYITLLLFTPIFYYSLNPYYMLRFIQNIGSVHYPVLILTALIAIYLLYLSKNSYLYFFLSILAGVLCTFSFVAGLSIWFAGLIQLVMQKMRNKQAKILVWIISSIATFYVYYIMLGFKTDGPHGTAAYSSFLETLIRYPIPKFLCFMGAIGSEVVPQNNIALYFGLMLSLVIVVLVYINHNSLELDRLSKWYGLLVFGALTTLEVALARSGSDSYFGSPDTILFIPDPRHSLAIFLPIICIYILSILYTKNSVEKNKSSECPNNFHTFCMNGVNQNLFVLGIVFTLLSLGIILHVMPGIDAVGVMHNQQTANLYYLNTYKIQTDENLRNLDSSATIVRDNAILLERYNLNIFAKDPFKIDGLFRIDSETDSNIDSVNDMRQPEPIVINKGDGAIEIMGWAVDKRADMPASAVFITIDDEMNIPSIYGLERPDVANAHKNRNFRYSGFRASFASSILGDGPHDFTIKIVSKDGSGYYVGSQIVNFDLRPAASTPSVESMLTEH